MTLTSPEIVLIIGSLFTGIVSVVNAIKSGGNGRKLDAVKVQTDQQDIKLETIHNVANGNLSKALTRIEELTAENVRLKEDIARFNQRSTV